MNDFKTLYHRNIAVLAAVLLFSIFGFFGNTQPVNAEAESEFESKATPKKTTPTPKKTTAKATPTPKRATPTPKKTTAKATPTPKKTTAKATPMPTPKKTVTNQKPKPTPTKKPAATQTTRTTTPTPKPTVSPTPQSNAVLSKIIINSPSVVIRNSASSGSAEISRARLGTLFSVVEKKSGWYRIQLPNQKFGWISAGAASDSNPNGNEEIYRQIAGKNFKAEKFTFGEAVEMFEFLTRVLPELKTANIASELGLKRLLALRYALNSIPSDKSGDNPYKSFLKAQEANVVYSEPSANWYVRANLFWDLHTKYLNTPSGEQIAWEGARTNLPGECEGYVNCYIFLIRMTDGEYLNYYPTGKYSTEALTNIIAYLEPIAADAQEKTVYNGPTETGDRAEFNSLITELRVIISRMTATEKEKALSHLKKIADGFK